MHSIFIVSLYFYYLKFKISCTQRILFEIANKLGAQVTLAKLNGLVKTCWHNMEYCPHNIASDSYPHRSVFRYTNEQQRTLKKREGEKVHKEPVHCIYWTAPYHNYHNYGNISYTNPRADLALLGPSRTKVHWNHGHGTQPRGSHHPLIGRQKVGAKCKQMSTPPCDPPSLYSAVPTGIKKKKILQQMDIQWLLPLLWSSERILFCFSLWMDAVSNYWICQISSTYFLVYLKYFSFQKNETEVVYFSYIRQKKIPLSRHDLSLMKHSLLH